MQHTAHAKISPVVETLRWSALFSTKPEDGYITFCRMLLCCRHFPVSASSGLPPHSVLYDTESFEQS